MINFSKAPNINYVWSQLMIEELIRCGADYFCLAPGSRCSPLTVAVAQNDRADSVIHFDERGLGFHALGYLSGSGRPAVVICTSGTAAANLLPSVIEASKKKLPLILLTADRPPELRQTGAHQTIDQVGLFKDYVRWAIDLPCPTKDINPEYVLTTIDQAVHRSKGELKGPVHINCMFREPLAPEKTQSNFTLYLKSISAWQSRQKPYTSYAAVKNRIHHDQNEQFIECIQNNPKGIIVVGKLSGVQEQKSVIKLAQNLNWPIFPDIVSGLRLGNAHSHVIHYFDQLLLSTKLQDQISPQYVLHLGGRITSKRWYQFMERVQPKEYIMVNAHPLRNDPLHNVTYRFQSRVSDFCEWALKLDLPAQSNQYVSSLKKESQKVERVMGGYFDQDKLLSEPFVASEVSKSISPRSALFLASSMPIRDFDMYGLAGANSVVIGSNRGASGIDGTIASAIGYSLGQNKAVTLLIGDLACLHDLNSMAMLESLSKPMTIIILNNNGGGIFSFLPIGEYADVFEKYFGTPHHLTFEACSQIFKIDYACPSSKENFTEMYQSALKSNKSTLIEVKTVREENCRLHQELQRKIQNAINKKETAADGQQYITEKLQKKELVR